MSVFRRGTGGRGRGTVQQAAVRTGHAGRGGDAVLLDVREPCGWQAEHAPRAAHLSLSALAAGAVATSDRELPFRQPVPAGCGTARRPRHAGRGRDRRHEGLGRSGSAGGGLRWQERHRRTSALTARPGGRGRGRSGARCDRGRRQRSGRPALVHLLGFGPVGATTASLVIVTLTSVTALVTHARDGNMRRRSGLLFAAARIGPAMPGGALAARIPAAVLTAAFARRGSGRPAHAALPADRGGGRADAAGARWPTPGWARSPVSSVSAAASSPYRRRWVCSARGCATPWTPACRPPPSTRRPRRRPGRSGRGVGPGGRRAVHRGRDPRRPGREGCRRRSRGPYFSGSSPRLPAVAAFMLIDAVA